MSTNQNFPHDPVDALIAERADMSPTRFYSRQNKNYCNQL